MSAIGRCSNQDVIYRTGETIGSRWNLIESVGEGNNGFVFSAHDLSDSSMDKNDYAIKIHRMSRPSDMIETEINFYQWAKDVSVCTRKCVRHIASLFDFGFHADGAIYFVAPYLGRSLDRVVETAPSKKLAVCVCVRIGRQILDSIMEVHQLGYSHRIIKPANFMMRLQSNGVHELYIIDFGRVRVWSDTPLLVGCCGCELLLERDCYGGAVYFTSLNGHAKQVLGRQDDLQSWLYVMAYMALGRLPWFDQARRNAVMLMKLEAENDPMMLFSLFPPEILKIRDYVRTLKFEDKPNYEALGALMDEALSKYVQLIARLIIIQLPLVSDKANIVILYFVASFFNPT